MTDQRNRKQILEGAISPYDNYCAGFGSPGASGDNYVLGIVLGVGKDKIQFGHPGSSLLDEINVFDRAEIDSTYIGQLNMSIVSSFCGPQGLVWGYDVARGDIREKEPLITGRYQNIKNQKIKVYSAWPLIKATEMLIGRRDKKKFIIKPGSHVPFAGKNTKFEGPKRIYCAIGLGVPEDRVNSAVLLMEDIGWIPIMKNGKDTKMYQSMVLDNLIRSIVKVGENQKIAYSTVYIALKDIEIQFGEIGCALVAAPYLTIAKNAVPEGGVESFAGMNLEQWMQSVKL